MITLFIYFLEISSICLIFKLFDLISTFISILGKPY